MSLVESINEKLLPLLNLDALVDAGHQPDVTDRLQKLQTIIIPKPTFSIQVGLWVISLLLRAVGRSLDDIELEITGENDKRYFTDRMVNPAYYLLGVGRSKYFNQRKDCFSQLMAVAQDFHVCHSIILFLVEMMNEDGGQGKYRDRGRGGWTKRWIGKFAERAVEDQYVEYAGQKKVIPIQERNLTFSRLIRDSFELNLDVDELIRQTIMVLDCWFYVQSSYTPSRQSKEFHKLLLLSGNDGILDTDYRVMLGSPDLSTTNCFSLANFTRDLALVSGNIDPHDGDSVADFGNTWGYWWDLSEELEQARWEARCRAREIESKFNADQLADLDIFYLKSKAPQGFNPRGLWITVENSFSARELFQLKDKKGNPLFHLVVAKNLSDGRVAILTGNIQLDLTQVMRRLSGHEGCWHHHEWRYPMIVNGGMRHHKPTNLTRNEIVGYISESATIAIPR